MRCSLFVAGYYLSVRLFVLVKGPVNKYRGGGGVGRSREGVGHLVFSLPNGVGQAILSLTKGWGIIF